MLDNWFLEVQRIVGDRCKVIGINKYCGEIFKTKELESAIEGGNIWKKH